MDRLMNLLQIQSNTSPTTVYCNPHVTIKVKNRRLSAFKPCIHSFLQGTVSESFQNPQERCDYGDAMLYAKEDGKYQLGLHTLYGIKSGSIAECWSFRRKQMN